jgi:hypothetical protein
MKHSCNDDQLPCCLTWIKNDYHPTDAFHVAPKLKVLMDREILRNMSDEKLDYLENRLNNIKADTVFFEQAKQLEMEAYCKVKYQDISNVIKEFNVGKNIIISIFVPSSPDKNIPTKFIRIHCNCNQVIFPLSLFLEEELFVLARGLDVFNDDVKDRSGRQLMLRHTETYAEYYRGNSGTWVRISQNFKGYDCDHLYISPKTWPLLKSHIGELMI